MTSSTRAVIAWAVTQDGSGLTSGMRSVDACATTAGSFSSVRTSCALGERIFANGRGSQAANEHRVGGERSRCAVSVTVSEARATMLVMPHDWFADLTGFREEGYDLTRSRLRVEVNELVSTVNDKRYRIGELSLPTLAELRARVDVPRRQRSTVGCVTGEARAMHADPELEGALFQVASQFNLLERLQLSRRTDSRQLLAATASR